MRFANEGSTQEGMTKRALEIFSKRALTLAPSKGKEPIHIIYNVTPEAQISIFGPENA